MKICMIGHKTIPSRDGGIEIVVEELASRMVSTGHSVTCFNRKRKQENKISEHKGIKLEEVFTINKKSLDAIVYSYFATRKAIKEAKKGNYDVVHFHAEGPCNFLNMFGKLGSRRRKKMPKVVVTIHGLDWQRGKWGGLATKILLRGEKQAVDYADEIIVLSQNNVKYFKEKYNRETIFIPNGVAPAILHTPEIIKDKWNLDKDDYILFLARIVPEKGVHYLIEAWKKVVKETKTNKKLVIAGGSSHSQDYFNEIKAMCDGDQTIIMTDFVTGQTLHELFSNAYLYVLPSDIEGMPMSLLEAIAYGNCCLVSNIPENVEVIGDEHYSFKHSDVLDLKEKLQDIINKEIVTHQKNVQTYNWDDVTKKTLELYEG